MATHPEQQPDEIYMGNVRPEELHQSSWRTKRLGTQPFDVKGAPIVNVPLLPWFIKRSEVEAAIRAEGIDDLTVSIYESMLADDKANS